MKPLAIKEHGAWDGLEGLADLPNGTKLYASVPNQPIYFLIKSAVYDHGVYWIGTDKEEGIKVTEAAAKSDYDSHHEWRLYEFVVVDLDYGYMGGDGTNHTLIHCARKTKK